MVAATQLNWLIGRDFVIVTWMSDCEPALK